jgi:dTDP-4-amino-4,6-dideoxygalactose transaminase
MPPSDTSIEVPFQDLSRHHALIADELREAYERVTRTNGFILGAEVERFEQEFAEFCGARHCVGVASGTAALMIMLRAAGIGPGDEVIVPAHTFLATALAVQHAGATPVAADVRPDTALIDPDAVAAAVTPQTAAILPVHLYGQVCEMDGLRRVAEKHGLAIFEDAAQAHGASYRGQARAGSLGTAGAFSFYPSKNLGALGDGGAVCTDDGALAERMRRLRDLGRSGDASHTVAGYNERLDGMQAAFLRVKLPHLEGWNDARRRAAEFYRRRLTSLELLMEREETPCVYHLFPVRVDDRDQVAARLREAGVGCGVHYPLSLPEQPALAGLTGTDAPVAREWAASELSLPIFPEISEAELSAVAEVLEPVSG